MPREPSHSRATANAPVALDVCLGKLLGHARAVGDSGEPEEVHQLRVSAARLRVWLKLAGIEALDHDLRWLRDQAAEVRDLDVHIEAHPPRALQRTLGKKRRAALEQLRSSLANERFRSLTRALALLPPIGIGRAEARLRKLARHAERLGRQGTWRDRGDGNAEHKGAIDSLHHLRRSVRRVRYALQWLERDASLLIDLQEALGDVCNGVMRLEKHPLTKSTARYHQRLRQELQQAQRGALQAWKKARSLLEELSDATVHHPPRARNPRLRNAAGRSATTH